MTYPLEILDDVLALPFAHVFYYCHMIPIIHSSPCAVYTSVLSI